MNIVVIEESKFNQVFLENLLLPYYNLHFVSSASEAFQYLATEKGIMTSLILVNTVLKDMSGFDFVKEASHIKSLQNTPFLFIVTEHHEILAEKILHVGALDFICPSMGKNEVLLKVRGAVKLKREMDKVKIREQELVVLTQELEESNKRLREISLIDEKLGISNRLYFNLTMEKEWKRSARNGSPFSVLFLEIDQFSSLPKLDEKEEHLQLLKQVVYGIEREIKRPGDAVCRYDASILAIILPDTPKTGCTTVLERMLSSLKKIDNSLTYSIGCASALPKSNESFTNVLIEASFLLEKAKRHGGNRIELQYKK